MKLLFLLPYFFTFIQGSEIKWNESTPLIWEDFSGNIDSESEFDAWTWSGFKYSYTWEIVDGGPAVECTAYGFFDPSQSWVKKKKKSTELLKHEQQHFNISELHSRYFEERIASHTFSYEVEQEIDSIYKVTFQELLDAQIEYDSETEHYKNKEEQLSWENWIKSELERLKEFE
jgi:hypothetical protein